VSKQSITVSIRGQSYRVLSDDDEETLHRVARYLDATLAKVEQRTGTIDSLDVALLTALNLAREIVDFREGKPRGGASGVPSARLRSLIELAESGLQPSA